jgi:hypothetical protein
MTGNTGNWAKCKKCQSIHTDSQIKTIKNSVIYLYQYINHANPEKYHKYKKYHDICEPWQKDNQQYSLVVPKTIATTFSALSFLILFLRINHPCWNPLHILSFSFKSLVME